VRVAVVANNNDALAGASEEARPENALEGKPSSPPRPKKPPKNEDSTPQDGARGAAGKVTLILVGAASFTGKGVKRVKKDFPVRVDKAAAGRLLATGLFKKV
jgi:hypothetical protein